MIKKLLALLSAIAIVVLSLCSFTTSTTPIASRANVPFDSLALPLYTPDIPDETYYLVMGDPRILPATTDDVTDYVDGGEWSTTYEFPLYQDTSIILNGNVHSASSGAYVAYTELTLDSETYLLDSTSSGIVLNLSDQSFTNGNIISIGDSWYPQRLQLWLYNRGSTISAQSYVNYETLRFSGDFHYINNVTGEVTTHSFTNHPLTGMTTYAPLNPSFTIAFTMNNLLSWLDLPDGYGYLTNASITIPFSRFAELNRIDFIDPITSQEELDRLFLEATQLRYNPVDPSGFDFGWIADATTSFFSLQLLPNISLFDIVTMGVGIALFIFVLKRFAGG